MCLFVLFQGRESAAVQADAAFGKSLCSQGATQSAGDAGFEVNLVHAELDFQAGDFDGVAGFVGDDVPADVAAPAVDFDLGLFLADEQVFLEAGQGAVGAEFFAAVGGFGGGGRGFQ